MIAVHRHNRVCLCVCASLYAIVIVFQSALQDASPVPLASAHLPGLGHQFRRHCCIVTGSRLKTRYCQYASTGDVLLYKIWLPKRGTTQSFSDLEVHPATSFLQNTVNTYIPSRAHTPKAAIEHIKLWGSSDKKRWGHGGRETQQTG